MKKFILLLLLAASITISYQIYKQTAAEPSAFNSESKENKGTLHELTSFLDITEVRFENELLPWQENGKLTELEVQQIKIGIEFIEEANSLEQNIREFFTSNRFIEDLSQAAGGPAGWQSGYIQNVTNQRCLVSYEPQLVRHENGETDWLSAQYRIFCTEN